MSTESHREMVSRLAYVGNLPSDSTAEEMKELCSQVGEVVMFRIVYDRETGKPKGYGFCEYRDTKLVDAAVDLLHGFKVKGQTLYVRRANQENNKNSISSTNSNNNLLSSNHNAMNKKNKRKKQNSSKRKSVDEITRVVSQFSTNEKREILSQMKVLIEQNENGAKKILLENPQLSQALLLIQMEFDLVKAHDIKALITNVSNKVITPQQPQQQQPSQQQSQSQPPPPQQQEQKEEKNNDFDLANMSNLSEQQRQILSKVLKMTPQQIANLPQHVQLQVRSVQERLTKNKMRQ